MFQTQVSEDINFRDIHVGRGRVSGAEADVPVSLVIVAKSRGSESSQQQNLQFLLHRFDEGWRIIGIQTK
jgi:hypothetical protein